MLKKIFDPTLFRFLLVGVVNTLVGYGVMFGLYNLAGLHLWGDPGYWISSAANYLVGSVVSFCLNKHSTFRSRETFFSAPFPSRRTTHRALSTGQTAPAPSSTAFWVTVSSLSPLGRHWHTVTWVRGSPPLGTLSSTWTQAPSPSQEATVQR